MHNMLMYMNNMLEGVDIDVMKNGFMQMFSGGVSAALQSFLYGVLTLICKVLGVFADLMNVVFYIFAGIDINSQNGSRYAIEVAGEKQNILDYFVLSETMRSAYFWLCVASVVLIVIFTIYKIIKQDYFEKSGPRSKGPIFRNVAISCISFLLVIPIFLVIIHASSLLAVVVMDMMGLNVNVLAGAKVFLLSWSDKGGMVSVVNSLYLTGKSGAEFTTMNNLDGRTLFTLLADKKSLSFASNLTVKNNDTTVKIISDKALNNGAWSDTSSLSEFGMMVGSKPTTAAFYWYIYLVGVIITIKSLYKMLLAMLQRIFKLMGLFLVAPSPISQYVLDDGQKFKSWLQQSIQEGLRLVSATMSFSIFLIALTLIGDISFTTALKASMSSTGVATRTILLANGSFTDTGNAWADFEQSVEGFASADTLAKFFNNTGSTIENFGDFSTAVVADVAGWIKQSPGISDATQWLTDGLWALGDAFIKIFMLIGAGGAIMDLDQVLTPLISGGKSSLDAGQTGAAADGLVKGTMAVAGAVGGAAFGAITQGIMNKGIAAEAKSEAKVQVDKEKADAQAQVGSQSNAPQPGNGGNGPVGPAGPGDTASAPETVNNNQQNDDNDENVENVENQENVENLENSEENNSETKDEENDNNQSGPAQMDDTKPTNRLKSLVGGGMNLLGKAAKGVGKVASVGAKGVGTVAKGVSRASGAIGLTAALKAGFKAAGGAVATAVFGKDVVKSFSDARGTAVKEANVNAAKRKEEIKEKEYTKLRNEQMKEAQQVVEDKSKDVNIAANELTNATNDEKPAAEALETAQTQAAADQTAADSANQAVAEQAKASTVEKKMTEAKQLKEVAEKENKSLEKNYGTRDDVVAKLTVAKNAGNQEDIKKYESVLKSYDGNNSVIKEANETIAQGQTKLSAIDTVTGKNGKLNKLLGDKANGEYKEVSAEIHRKLASNDLSDSDRKELEIARSELMSVGSKVYDSDAAKQARSANAASVQSKQELSKAQANYNTKHQATVNARNNLQGKLNELNNAVSVVNKLDDITNDSKNPYTNKHTGGINKDGSYEAAKNSRSRNKRIEGLKENSGKARKNSNDTANLAKHTAEAAQNSSNVPLNNLSKKNINDRLDSLQEINDNKIKVAGQERDSKISQAADRFNGQVIRCGAKGSSEPLKAEKVSNFDFIENGKINKKKLDEFKANHSIHKDDIAAFEESIKTYNTSVKSAETSYQEAIKQPTASNERIGTARNVIDSVANASKEEHSQIEKQAQAKEQQARLLLNQINAINDVIDSGGNGSGVTASTMKMIRGRNGSNVSEGSKPELIVQEAQKAKQSMVNELNGLVKDIDNLSVDSQRIADTLTSTITSALQSAGINVNVGSSNNGTNQGVNSGNNTSNIPGSGVAGPNNVQNITNVNNNNNIQGENNENELPASSGLAQSKDLNAYYERMQVESIKHVQSTLDIIKRRDEEIQRDVEIIKNKDEDK